jgi:hypothetical protein
MSLNGMHPDLEADFLNQQTLLRTLIAQRRDATDGTQAAARLDEQIIKTEELIRSYRVMKWYESYGMER